MSALPPKADMLSAEIDVCFVPQADISRSATTPISEGPSPGDGHATLYRR
jgi:hypothetical protein